MATPRDPPARAASARGTRRARSRARAGIRGIACACAIVLDGAAACIRCMLRRRVGRSPRSECKVTSRRRERRSRSSRAVPVDRAGGARSQFSSIESRISLLSFRSVAVNHRVDLVSRIPGGGKLVECSLSCRQREAVCECEGRPNQLVQAYFHRDFGPNGAFITGQFLLIMVNSIERHMTFQMCTLVHMRSKRS